MQFNTERAIDITIKVPIQIPQTLNLTFEAGESAPLWIVPIEKMPYGLTTISGQALICSHGNSFKYKAWRYVDPDKLLACPWQLAPDFLSSALPRLTIYSHRTENTYCSWSAAYEGCWQEKGVYSFYTLTYGAYKKTCEEDIPFSRFMEINYQDLLSLLD
ncbi:hypothetical protein QT972_09795 [Microcoleus sp. herbarium7]|uniref:hypothetical protein n=1 Tax=Microcoleus sp. herbarium7 TaxID=3055435 RepID=UPI002FD045E8